MSRTNKSRKRRATKNNNPPARKKPTIEALEPRILLSATWTGTGGDDVFFGGNGVDEAYGLDGDDEMHGGKQNDLLYGGSGNDQLFGDQGKDLLDGGAGDDQLFGGIGNDILISGGGNDYLDGGSGNDTFDVTGGQDGNTITVVGSLGGNDTIDVSNYSDSQITDDGSTMTIDMGGGQSFTVNYNDVNHIVTSDGTYDPGSIPASNLDPDAVDDAAVTTQDNAVTTGNVLANDTDADGDTLSITGFTQASNGTVVDNGDGTFTYTPNSGFTGNDSFQYTVDDGNGGTDTATVNVTVDAPAPPPNSGPDAVDDAAVTTQDNAVTTGNVLANDTDADGDTLSITGFTQGANGTVVDNGDGTFTYTPNSGFTGNDSFQYTVDDGNGGTDTATVNVTVDAAPAPPPPPPPSPPVVESVEEPAPEETEDVVLDPVVQDPVDVVQPDEAETVVVTPPPPVPDEGGTGDSAAGDSTSISDSQAESAGTPIVGVEWDGSEQLDILDPAGDLADSIGLIGDEAVVEDANADSADDAPASVGNDVKSDGRFEAGASLELAGFATEGDAPLPLNVEFPAGATVEEVFEVVSLDGASNAEFDVQTAEATLESVGATVGAASQPRFGSFASSDNDDDREDFVSRRPGGDDGGMVEGLRSGAASATDGVEADFRDVGETAGGGFFASLWGAVRGLGGTNRRGGDRRN